MSPIIRTIGCALLLASAATLQAQGQETTGNPGVNSPKTPGADIGKPPANVSNTADEIFLRQAGIGGRQEVDLAKLAGQRAQDQAVKDFAKQMVNDHSKTNDKVMQLAKAHGVAVPKNPDPDQQAVR